MTATEVALFAFTACNTLRVVAYVPQLIRIARDSDGARAISYATWGLFGLSHLSTVAYAITALDDWRLAFIFGLNAAACGAILLTTLYKRIRYAAREVEFEASAPCAPDHGAKARAVREGLRIV